MLHDINNIQHNNRVRFNWGTSNCIYVMDRNIAEHLYVFKRYNDEQFAGWFY